MSTEKKEITNQWQKFASAFDRVNIRTYRNGISFIESDDVPDCSAADSFYFERNSQFLGFVPKHDLYLKTDKNTTQKILIDTEAPA